MTLYWWIIGEIYGPPQVGDEIVFSNYSALESDIEFKKKWES